jgi:hypothetical protein
LAVGEAVECFEAALSGRGILENIQVVEGKGLLDVTGSQDLDPGDIMPELCQDVAEVDGVRDGGAGEGAGSVVPSPDDGELDRPEIHVKSLFLKDLWWHVNVVWDENVTEPSHGQEVLLLDGIQELHGKVPAGVAKEEQFFIEKAGIIVREIDCETRIILNPFVIGLVGDGL